MYARLTILVCFVFFHFAEIANAQPTQSARQRDRQSSLPTLSRDDAAAIVSTRLDQEIKEKLNPRMDDVKQTLDQANKVQEAVHEQVTLVVHLMEVFLGFLAIVLAVGGLELWKTRGLRKVAEEHLSAARDLIQTSVGEAEKGSKYIKEMEDGMRKTSSVMDAQFEKLPKIQQFGIAGHRHSSLSPKDQAFWQDNDTFVVVTDRLQIAKDAEQKAAEFRKLATYWRVVYDFPRASLRANRAVELTPDHAETRLAAAKTYAYWAASDRDSPDHDELLRSAMAELDALSRIEGRSSRVLHLSAWIADEGRKFDVAIEEYKRAIALEPNNKRFVYDLACTFAKAERYGDACATLVDIIRGDVEWMQRANEDEDFEVMRKSDEWKKLVAK